MSDLKFVQGVCSHKGMGILSVDGIDYCARCFHAGEQSGYISGLKAAAIALSSITDGLKE